MSGSRNSLASLGSFGAFSAGRNLAIDERAADQRYGVNERAIADDDYFRDSSAGILANDPAVTQRAIGINPQRVQQMQGVQNAQQDRQFGEAQRREQMLGSFVTSLLSAPEDQWPTLYPQIRQRAAQFNITLPENVPTRDGVVAFGAALRTPAQNLAEDRERPRLGPAVGGAPAGGGAAPPQGDELDFMARMIHMEAANQGEAGMGAVAHTILNRSRLSGRPVRDIITAPEQFEPWGNPQRRQQMLSMTPEQYAAARRVAEAAVAGQMPDPTNGATHFLNPDLQRQLGRSQPAWAPEGQGQRIGAHVFYRIPQDFQRAQQAAQPAAAEGGIPAGARQRLDANRVPIRRGDNYLYELPDGSVIERPAPRAPTGRQYQFLPGQDGSIQRGNLQTGEVEVVPGASRPPTAAEARREQNQNARLPTGERSNLQDISGAARSLQRLLDTFKPEYAGQPLTGRIANAAGRTAPEWLLGRATGDQAQFWQAHAASANIERNALFGATLTANEKAAWAEADINPGMTPDQITKNLTRRRNITRDVLARIAQSLEADGYRREAIEPFLSGNPAAALEPGAVENGWRFRGGNPADQANWERVQ